MIKRFLIAVFSGLSLGGTEGIAFAQQAAPDLPAVQTPAELRFDIERFDVRGNTLLPAQEIARLVGPFVGKQRDFGDVQRALEEIENAYRVLGYSAVQVALPEQELDKGVVVLRVTEARIKLVEIVDIRASKYFDEANVRASLPALQIGMTPNSNDIAKNLRIVNESGAKQTNVTMRAGANEGDIEVVVDVTEENPQKAFITLDNTGTGSSGYERIGFGYQHSNLFGRDHAMTVQYITSLEKPDKLSVYSFGYHVPLYAQGASMDFTASYSDSNAGTTITPAGPFSFSGAGGTLGVRYNKQLLRSMPGYDHKLVFGLDHRMYRNACSVGSLGVAGCGTAGQTFSLTPVTLGYVSSLSIDKGIVSFNASANSNLHFGSDYDSARAIAGTRFGAVPGYWVYRFGVNLAQALADDWQARVRLDMQYTGNALMPAEQFGIGGFSSVRGFLERERADDRGHSGSVELYAPDLAVRFGLSEGTSLRVLGFYDFGRTSRVKPQPGEVTQNGIASSGVGMRYSYKKSTTLRLDVARIVDEGGTRLNGHYRATAGAVWSF